MPDARKVWCLLAAAVVVSCGGAGGEPDAAPTTAGVTTTSVEVTTTTRVLSDEEAVLAAVEGYWRVLFDSSDPPDPDHPGLVHFLTGAALERTLDVVRERQASNLRVRLPEVSRYEHQARIIEIDGDAATVHDCGVDDGVLYDATTGDVIDDAVATTLRELRLTRRDGRWRVDETIVLYKWDGIDGCAVQ